ncbi:MAG: tRNA 2-selenouridine(34) synthase MnmH [Candidatus Marinimicrobia bacterium]|nr:tRNA 2-selenouridine(34) synthase MnmH [Candidatus Neomarinimicrobiota bacterium]
MIPLIDLRSPKEFEKGAFPQSVNYPILMDNERAQVGKTYKHQGRDAAIVMGHTLVSNEIKEKRIHEWKLFFQYYPTTMIYCARGGLRSQIAQTWLQENGINVERIKGGFKLLRNTAIELLDSAEKDNKEWIILGGKTGTGKTDILNQMKSTIDLEQLANHRGSAFGKTDSAQPSQINFEHSLAIHYMNHTRETLFLEDESRTIGRVAIPNSWYQRMRLSKWVLIDIPLEERIANIQMDYIDKPLNTGVLKTDLLLSLRSSLFKIQKRLGNEVFIRIRTKMDNAFLNPESHSHQDWIHDLLTLYYDRLYEYQIASKMDRCIYESNSKGVLGFLSNLESS